MQSNREHFYRQSIYEVIEPAKRRFAWHNGWQLSRKPFSLSALAPRRPRFDGHGFEPDQNVLLDHREYYRRLNGNGRPAAIVAHSYKPDAADHAEALAQRLGIHVACPVSASWWYPARAHLLIFTGDGEVVLPTSEEIAEFGRAHAAFEAELHRRHPERLAGDSLASH